MSVTSMLLISTVTTCAKARALVNRPSRSGWNTARCMHTRVRASTRARRHARTRTHEGVGRLWASDSYEYLSVYVGIVYYVSISNIHMYI